MCLSGPYSPKLPYSFLFLSSVFLVSHQPTSAGPSSSWTREPTHQNCSSSPDTFDRLGWRMQRCARGRGQFTNRGSEQTTTWRDGIPVSLPTPDEPGLTFYLLVPLLRREADLVELTHRLVSEEQILRDQRTLYTRLEHRLQQIWDQNDFTSVQWLMKYMHGSDVWQTFSSIVLLILSTTYFIVK